LKAVTWAETGVDADSQTTAAIRALTMVVKMLVCPMMRDALLMPISCLTNSPACKTCTRDH
jgi:hypothetical protein